MGAITSWDNLPIELVSVIAQRVDCLDYLIILSAVCKSWNSALSKLKLRLPPKDPWLLLAEDCELDFSSAFVTELEANPCNVNHCPHHADNNDDGDNNDDNNVDNDVDDDHNHADNNDDGDNNGDDDNGDFQITQVERIITSIRDLFQNPSSIRGFYSLAKQKIYYLDLPEAVGRVIFGTNKGWLVTLGRDLEINLLHPLMRYQISLPPMLTLPCQYEYDDDFPPQRVYTMFLKKVVMSSQVPRESQDTNNLPTIMAIYGEFRVLAFAREGDELWKPVETNTRVFEDIVYHKEKFYAIDCHWNIFACDTCKDDKREGQSKGIKITSVPLEEEDMVTCYLIESLSGSHLWVVLRFKKGEYYNGCSGLTAGKLRYITRCFSVFRLEIQYTNFNDIPSCKWSGKVNDVGSEALFIGQNSSVSLASSEFIKPNSIYFTDDEEIYLEDGGGHDMGIFNIETGTIEPHFQGASMHQLAPPVWYI